MRRTTTSFLLGLLLAATVSAQLPMRIKSGGTGTEGPFVSQDLIYANSTGLKFLGLPIGSVGNCLLVATGPALAWGDCILGPSVYELSTTSANGITKTFSFSSPVVQIIAAFIGGMVQKPGDVSLIAGSVVFGAGVPAPATGVPVTALIKYAAGSTGGGAHNLLSGTHSDTTPASGARGDVIVFGTASWAALHLGTQYQVFQAGALDPAYGALHLDQSAAVTGILGVTNGGLGANDAATSSRYLKGDGSVWKRSTGPASGTGACTNQVVTGLNSDAPPTCSTVTINDTSGLDVVDIQTFTASGTWTKPAHTQHARATCIGGGGGGGSGTSQNWAGTGSVGAGGGGGGGAIVSKDLLISDLASTVAVTVAGSAAGGAATNGPGGGNSGTQGGDSSFGAHFTAYGGASGTGGNVFADGDGGGGGGSAGAGSGRAGGRPQTAAGGANGLGTQGAGAMQASQGNAEYGGGAGGGSGIAGGSSIFGAPGGGAGGSGGGGGVNPSNGTAGGAILSYTVGGGGAGGARSLTSAAASNGTAGTNGTLTSAGTGGGGGGGAVTSSSSAGNGGNGGAPGAGGGGGGAIPNGGGPTSGKGGDGARGECRVVSW